MKRIFGISLLLVLCLSLAACELLPVADTNAPDTKQETEQMGEQTDKTADKPATPARPVEDVQPEADAAAPEEAKEPEETPEEMEQVEEAAEKDESKEEVKEEEKKESTVNNGSLTTSQVKEMQRWYGVSADGQWGSGSSEAAGGRDADSAWAYYQKNRKEEPEQEPENTGSESWMDGMQVTVYENTGKANVDCEEAMRVGNEYAVSLGFYVEPNCSSYRPPCYFEEDFPSSQWNQETFNAAVKGKVDSVKNTLEKNGRWLPDVEGWYMGIYCVARWNEAGGYHEIYVYYGG